jgi:hypothetical protein
MSDECKRCGEEKERLAQHWAMSSSCTYPEISQKEDDIFTGLMMGDGSISNKHMKNQYIKVDMTNRRFLEHIDSTIGNMSKGVTFLLSAEENARRKRESGFSPNAKKENYSDVYKLSTRSHPYMAKFTRWYSSGEKIWPENIELSPTVLKYWYVCDGNMQSVRGYRGIQISMCNEYENTEKVDKYFEKANLPKPSNYNINHREGRVDCSADFTASGSKKLWEYMGDPLPGFEYKWPEEYR